MSPEQEQLVCDALVQLAPVETEQGLHAEGVRKIQEVLGCTLPDAQTTLRELRVRKRIEETTYLPSTLTSRTFGGYSRQRNERETEGSPAPSTPTPAKCSTRESSPAAPSDACSGSNDCSTAASGSTNAGLLGSPSNAFCATLKEKRSLAELLRRVVAANALRRTDPRRLTAERALLLRRLTHQAGDGRCLENDDELDEHGHPHIATERAGCYGLDLRPAIMSTATPAAMMSAAAGRGTTRNRSELTEYRESPICCLRV